MNNNITTKEGYEKVVKKLEELKSSGRQDISERIRIAKEYGDLSENSEYDEALKDQGELEAEIYNLEQFLKNVSIVEALDSDGITVGSKVMMTNTVSGQIFNIKIVGNSEASPLDMNISIVSPIGRALLGKKENDVIEVETPSGTRNYKINKVEV